MSTANTAVKVLTNRKVLIGVGIIILVLIVWKNYARWIAALKRRDQGEYDPLAQNSVRQAELKAMANDVHTALHSIIIFGGVTWSGREAIIERLLTINDAELRFVATYYQDQLNQGTSLAADLQDEMWTGTPTQQVLSRLSELNL